MGEMITFAAVLEAIAFSLMNLSSRCPGQAVRVPRFPRNSVVPGVRFVHSSDSTSHGSPAGRYSVVP